MRFVRLLFPRIQGETMSALDGVRTRGRYLQLAWWFVHVSLLSLDSGFGQEISHTRQDPYSLTFDDLEWQESVEVRPIKGAVAMRLVGDPGAGIAMFERRVDDSSNDFANRTILGQLLLRYAKDQDDLPAFERSENVLREALANNPDYAPANLALARTLMARHGFKEALQLAIEVNTAAPNQPSHLAVLFDCQLEIGEYALAAQTLGRLRKLEDSAPVLARAARLCELSGERTKAISLIQSAIVDLQATANDGQESMAWYLWRLGTLQFDAGRIREAAASFSQGLSMAAEDEALLVGMAHTQFASGDLPATIATLEKAAANEAPPVLSLLGDAYRLAGDDSKAEELWRRTDETMREEAEIAKAAHSREVAKFYADHNLKPEQAVELSELDLSQRSAPHSWDCHAWALFKNGQTESARESINKALLLASDDCNLLYHAAAIECASKNVVQARRYIERIESINPNFSITYSVDFKTLQSQLKPLQ